MQMDFADGLTRISPPFRRSLVFGVLIVLCGCGGRGKLDMLESRLRERESQLYDLQSQLNRNQSDLQVARQESQKLREQLASSNKEGILPEQVDLLYRGTGIRLNTLLTGGLNQDNVPGDEILSVVIQPHDAEDGVLKVPGKIEIEVLDMNRPETDRLIGQWAFSESETATSWQQGFVGSGYRFELPLGNKATSERVLINARLTTPDGRTFQTQGFVTIEPPATQMTSNEASGKVKLSTEPRTLPSATAAPIRFEQSRTQPIERLSGNVIPAGFERPVERKPVEPTSSGNDFKNFIQKKPAE